MNQEYYNMTVLMEKNQVDKEYIQGWQGGYLHNPVREEQRLTQAYEAGYADGKEKNREGYKDWV